MRRYCLILLALNGLLLAVGCAHIGGKHDCGYHPANAVIPPPTPPYPAVPVPATPPAAKMSGAELPVDPAPAAADVGSLP